MVKPIKFFLCLFVIFTGILAAGIAAVASTVWTYSYIAARCGNTPAAIGLTVFILATTAGLVTLGRWLNGEFD